MKLIKRGRGRPRKEKLAVDDQIEALLLKAFDFSIDEDGKVLMTRNTEPLSLEETALLLWAKEGKKTAKPFSKMYMLKIEQNALKKIRAGFAKYGITKFDDVFGARDRMWAKSNSATDCPE